MGQFLASADTDVRKNRTEAPSPSGLLHSEEPWRSTAGRGRGCFRTVSHEPEWSSSLLELLWPDWDPVSRGSWSVGPGRCRPLGPNCCQPASCK